MSSPTKLSHVPSLKSNDARSSSRSASSESSASASSEKSSSSILKDTTPSTHFALLERIRKQAAEQPEDAEEEILFDPNANASTIPHLEPGSSLPPPYIRSEKGRTGGRLSIRNLDAERILRQAESALIPAPAEPAYELTKSGQRLTKREKKEMKNVTAGSNWFDLPAPPASELPRLHREVEAMRLRNAMDPKRFYRKDESEGKGVKGLPKYFAIGTIVPTSMPFGTASSDNLTRAERKRTLVDELVDDAETKRYAKKKFEDLQQVRGERGRGTFARRFGARRKKW